MNTTVTFPSGIQVATHSPSESTVHYSTLVNSNEAFTKGKSLQSSSSPLRSRVDYSESNDFNSIRASSKAKQIEKGLANYGNEEVDLFKQTKSGLSISQTSQPNNRIKKTKESAITDPLTGISKDAALVVEGQDQASAETFGSKTAGVRTAGLPYPGYLLKYEPGLPLKYSAAAKQWQERMRERGWNIRVDGLYGLQSKEICMQFQQEKGLLVDGIVGRETWITAFRSDNLTNGTPGGAAISINQKGIELVKRFEGFSAQAYRDPVGIWTIGYGHTGAEVGPGDVITKAEGEALLKRDLAKFESAVRQLVKVPLNSNQFSALVSFTYNLGAGALASSTLLRLLNQRNYRGAADQFPKWVYADGRKLPGLVTRRAAERALFLTPTA